jgi:hypothetical protein
VLRLAYADPPYPGLSRRYYGEHPDFAGEVDHGELIRSLSTYDGWALSTSARALPMILELCPPEVRVAAWFRGERPTRSAGPLNAWEPVIYWGGRRDVSRFTAAAHDASPRICATRTPGARDVEHDASAGDRRRVGDLHTTHAAAQLDASRAARATRSASIEDASGEHSRRIDTLIYRPGVRRTDPARVVGAKPAAFCRWMFDLLGAEPQDEFTDVFPGSGGVLRAWRWFAGLEVAS